MFKISKDIAQSSFYPLTFRTTFSFNQLLSLLSVMQDFVYTGCYVAHRATNPELENQCSKRVGNIQLGLVFFFLMMRQLHEIKKFMDLLAKKASVPPKDFRYFCFCFCYGTFRMGLSFAMIILSSYTKNNPKLNALYWCLTILAMFIHVTMDTMISWGLGWQRDLLREKLCYPHKSFYYTAIFSNFFMRFNWLLSLTSYKNGTTLQRNILSLVNVFIEPTRRFMWNFFKGELGHIKILGSFSVIDKYNFPYKVDVDMAKPDVRQSVEYHFSYYLNKAYGNQNYVRNSAKGVEVKAEE